MMASRDTIVTATSHRCLIAAGRSSPFRETIALLSTLADAGLRWAKKQGVPRWGVGCAAGCGGLLAAKPDSPNSCVVVSNSCAQNSPCFSPRTHRG